MRIVGIDPGMTGALAVVEQDAGNKLRVVTIIDMPVMGGKRSEHEIDDIALIKFLREMAPAYAFIERSSAMPNMRANKITGEVEAHGMGSVSAFRYGYTIGQIRTCVRGCKIPFTLVSPVTWKNFHKIKKGDAPTISAVKEMSRHKAINLFPAAHYLMPNKGHHNRAEALLIAGWGYLNGAPIEDTGDRDDAA
jgi:hypothetical protein